MTRDQIVEHLLMGPAESVGCSTILALLLQLLGVAGETTTISASWLSSDGRVQSGAELQLRCEVSFPFTGSNMHLLCPLNKATSCAQDCKSVLSEISCREESRGNLRIFTFTIVRVRPSMAGSWYCQQRSVSSVKLDLIVTERPEIVSLTVSANPVQEGLSTRLTCTAKASSSGVLSFVWRFKGSTLSGVAEGTHTSVLTIPDVNRSADGIYTCEVSNAAANKATQSVVLNVYYPPSSIRLVSSHRSPLEQGTRVSLSCHADGGRPTPTFQYFRKRPTVLEERVGSDFVVSKTDNQAEFFCRASSAGIKGGNIDSKRMKFDVLFPPSGIRVVEAPSVEVKEGQTQMLRCSTTSSGNPTPRLEWQRITKEGEKTVMAPNTTAEIEDLEHSAFSVEAILQVVALRQRNADAYQCNLLYQDSYLTSQRVQFKVIFGPNGVSLNANPAGGVRETFPVFLQCEAQVANPPAKVVWRRQNLGGNSKDVTYLSSANMKQGQFGGSSVLSRLKVTETSRAYDLDSYTCRVEHTESAVTLTKTFYLRVFYPPTVKITAVPASPVEGQAANLTCITSGGKPMSGLSYTWLHRQSNGELSTLTSSTEVHTIRSVSHLNSGSYTCEVSNEGGRAEAQFDLVVKYSPVLLSTTELTVSGIIGDTATLVLRLMAYPKPISAAWYKLQKKDNESPTRIPVEFGDKYKENRDDFTFTLQISNIEQADFGEYVCDVQHIVRSKSFTFRFVAPGPPTTPSALRIINTTAVSATLAWKSEFRGGSVQTFALQYREAVAPEWPGEDQVQGIADPGYHKTVTTVTRGLKGDSLYEFRIRARNVKEDGKRRYSPYSGPLAVRTKVPPIISASSLGVSITGNRACITFTPPERGHFSHIVVRACAGSIARCHDHHVAEPQFGKACFSISGQPTEYNFKLLAFDGATPVFESDYFRAKTNLQDWPMEIVIGVSVGVAIIVVSLTVAVIVLIVMRCRRERKPGISMSSTDSHTTSSSRRRRDYLLIGTEAEIISQCRCSTPPASDCQSVHSLHSSHHAGLQAGDNEGKQKPDLVNENNPEITDNLSLRSGGSRPPDLVLTDQFYLPHSRSSVASSGNSRTSLLSSTRASASTSDQGTDSGLDRRNKVIGPDTVPQTNFAGSLPPVAKNRLAGAYRPSAYQHSLPPTVETNLDTMENYV